MTYLQLGCSSPKEFVYRDYQNLSIKKLGFGSSTVRLELVYFNPNNFGLQLKNADFEVYLDGAYVGHSSQEMQITIPKNAEFTLPIQVDVDMKNLWKNALTSALSKEVTVKIKGSLKAGKANIFKIFPVNYEGKHQFSIF